MEVLLNRIQAFAEKYTTLNDLLYRLHLAKHTLELWSSRTHAERGHLQAVSYQGSQNGMICQGGYSEIENYTGLFRHLASSRSNGRWPPA